MALVPQAPKPGLLCWELGGEVRFNSKPFVDHSYICLTPVGPTYRSRQGHWVTSSLVTCWLREPLLLSRSLTVCLLSVLAFFLPSVTTTERRKPSKGLVEGARDPLPS